MAREKTLIHSVDLVYAKHVNWSLINAHIPVIFHLSVATTHPVHNVSLRTSVQAWGKEYAKYETTIPQIFPGKPWSVNNLTDREFIFWDFERAAALSHSIPATLKVELQADKTAYSASGPLELLAYNEWHQAIKQLEFPNGRKQALNDPEFEAYHLIVNLPPRGHISSDSMKKHWGGDPPLEAGIASLIFANHRLLKEYAVDSQAQDFLRIVTGNPSATTLEYATGSPKQRQELLHAIYMMLLEKYPAFYSREDPSYKITSQRVRFPDEILPLISRIRARIQKQVGTCIDFVLMFCAILERLGLRPLIIIVEHGGHAMAGCWMDDGSTFKEGIVCRDKEEIKKLKNANKIFGIDITECAKNKPYSEAVNKGQTYLDRPSESFCYAVDLQAARGAGIEPLIVPPKPRKLKILAFLVIFIAAAVAIWVLTQSQKPAPPDVVDVLEMLRADGARISCQHDGMGEAGYGWEGASLKVHYDLQKGYVACWITFSAIVTSSNFETLVVKVEGDPTGEAPKEFTIELKTSDPQKEPHRYRISPLNQRTEELRIVGLREIGEVAIVFYEERVGVQKGTIYITTLKLRSWKEEDTP